MAKSHTPSTVVTSREVSQPLSAWADGLGCRVQTLLGRLDRGWTIEKTVTSPVGTTGGSNRGQKLAPEVLTPVELLAVLGANNKGLTGTRNKALIVVGWRAGLRISETLALKLGDLNPEQQTVRILHGKGDKARTVGLDASAWAMVDQWIIARQSAGIAPTAPLFCTSDGGKLADRYVRELLPRLARDAGINKRCHYHGLRHTMAFELASEGVPMHIIQQQLGHSNLAVTSRYISHLNPAETISRMRSRQWGGDGASTGGTAGHVALAVPDWLERLRADIGDRLISFTDARRDAVEFKVVVTVF